MKSYYDNAVKVDPKDGFWKRSDGKWEIMLHHELHGVTVPMISWWFDNIDTTDRYKLWDPKNHLKFEWVIDPHKNGHISAIHKVTQKMAGVPMSMSFRYTEPDGYDRTEGYDHVITADYCGLLVGKIIRSSYIYEWKETEYGVLVNSRYILSGWVPRWACKAIYDHDYPEQKRFQDFLPDLYRSCVSAE